MDEIYRAVNFDIRKSGVLQMLSQSSFREDPHFQRCAGAAAKYEIVELLNNPCPCFVSQHERTLPLDYAEFVEFWEMLDCFPLGTIGHSENEQPPGFNIFQTFSKARLTGGNKCSKTSDEMMKSFPTNFDAILAAAISSLGSLW